MSDLGYGWDKYPVLTEDGYTIAMIRLFKQGENRYSQIDRPPVLIGHGLGMTSEAYLVKDDEFNYSPAIWALESGWDVWLANNRGTRFSIYEDEALGIDSTTNQYWDFEFTTMGRYDLPAMIDEILETTQNYSKINYIAYSQGTSQMFYGLATNPDYFKDRINMFSAIAPVTNLSHSTDPLIVGASLIYAYLLPMIEENNIWSLDAPHTAADLEKMCDSYWYWDFEYYVCGIL